ncbi:MAG: GerMN domain-containing protein [Clostridiaceae bacterium]|nr:GerMN domain-containing protein [Clostridiaceae bacterium]MBW4861005.1 GerMN domain-containing protein [Clostridiaceae bacterium]MBW4867630.1 GerMN domain-containing protein [Clostridiaceae bacterium]
MKKYIAIFLSTIMLLSLTACSSSEKTPKTIDKQESENEVVDENQEETINENEEDVEETEETSEEVNEKEVTLYFVNKKYIETGDESLEKLVPEKRVVKYDEMPIEEAIVRELMKGTEDDKISTVIPSSVELIDVKVSDKTAFVNFKQEGLHGGSLEERFTLDQIIKSLIELENVDKVQFLIDSQKAETLMEHLDISEPFDNIIE